MNLNVEFSVFGLFLCWVLLIFEPYGMRLRHRVMNKFYPDKAKERAAWLYNNILRKRQSFMKYARREARIKFGIDKEHESLSCIDFLRAKYNQ